MCTRKTTYYGDEEIIALTKRIHAYAYINKVSHIGTYNIHNGP